MKPLEEIRAEIASHKAKRPDALKAKALNASPSRYHAWIEWCDELERLKTLKGMAEAEVNSRWHGRGGEDVEPGPWAGKGNLRDMRNRRQRGISGPIPLENPSKETLQRREQRARKKSENK